MREEFISFPVQSGDSHFAVNLAGISYCDESYIIRRDKSALLVAEYVIRGEGTVLLDDRTYHAGANDIYILPAHHDQLYFAHRENPWEKIWVNVTGTLPESLLREYNPGNMLVFPDAGGREYFERIHEIGKNDQYSGSEKHNKAALVFHELLQYLYGRYYEKEVFSCRETVVLKEYLDNHIRQNVSLKELSELVFLSESQIVRIFKRDTGKTPHEYLLELKMEYGKRLLKNTRLMVREISEYLGFSDEHYFSYLFKKKTGNTPLNYRAASVRNISEGEDKVRARNAGLLKGSNIKENMKEKDI